MSLQQSGIPEGRRGGRRLHEAGPHHRRHDSEIATAAMRELYAPFNRNHDKMIVMDVRSAEFTKYAANAMLATKISFMNEMANLAEQLGADIEEVRKGIGSRSAHRLPLHLSGLRLWRLVLPEGREGADQDRRRRRSFDASCCSAVEERQQRTEIAGVRQAGPLFLGNLKGKTFALWGLAFKPHTDDMREAPSAILMEAVWAAGGNIRAYDPVASHECERIYGKRDDLILVDTPEAACDGADALAIVTEWRVFHSPNFARIKSLLKHAVIVDGRNLYEPSVLKEAGFKYFAIGRGEH
jgi:UDPglucose 6-dehydrogenase